MMNFNVLLSVPILLISVAFNLVSKRLDMEMSHSVWFDYMVGDDTVSFFGLFVDLHCTPKHGCFSRHSRLKLLLCHCDDVVFRSRLVLGFDSRTCIEFLC